jgi:N-acetylglutamate synthase-like GNAT family acetyltransferase
MIELTPDILLEILGYLGSVIVLISLTMSSIKKLRWINLVGSLIFGTYGILTKMYPTALLNYSITIINIYYLIKLSKQTTIFKLLEVNQVDTIELLLRNQIDSIERIFGDYDAIKKESNFNMLVMHGTWIVGLIMSEIQGDSMIIKVDYAIPEYRDFKLGDYVFNHKHHLINKRGIRQLVTSTENKEHVDYLMKIGFEQIESGQFAKKIAG